MSRQDASDGPAVNGISAANRSLIIDQLGDARRLRAVSGPWDVHVSWKQGFASTATVRGHEIRFDQPGDIAAGDTAPTPHEYLLSCVAGCLIAGVVMHATVARVQLTTLDVHVSGTFDNVLKWAGIESEGNPGYRGLDLRATIAGEADDETLRDIWDRAVGGSPVTQTVNRATPIVATLDIV